MIKVRKKLRKAQAKLEARRIDWEKCKGLGACPKHTHKRPGSLKK